MSDKPKHRSALDLYAEQAGVLPPATPLLKYIPSAERGRVAKKLQSAAASSASKQVARRDAEDNRVAGFKSALETYWETGDKQSLRKANDLMTLGERMAEFTKLKYHMETPREFSDMRVTDLMLGSALTGSARGKNAATVDVGYMPKSSSSDGVKETLEELLDLLISNIPFPKPGQKTIAVGLSGEQEAYAVGQGITPAQMGTYYPAQDALSGASINSNEALDRIGRWVNSSQNADPMLDVSIPNKSNQTFAVSRAGEVQTSGPHGFSLGKNPFAGRVGGESIAFLEPGGEHVPTFLYGGITRENEMTMFGRSLHEIADFPTTERRWLSTSPTVNSDIIPSTSIKELMEKKFGMYDQDFGYSQPKFDEIIKDVFGSTEFNRMRQIRKELISQYNTPGDIQELTPELFGIKKIGKGKYAQSPTRIMGDYDLPEIYGSGLAGHPSQEIVFNTHAEFGTFLERMMDTGEPINLAHTGAGYRMHPLSVRADQFKDPSEIFDYLQSIKSSELYNKYATRNPSSFDLSSTPSSTLNSYSQSSKAMFSERMSPKPFRAHDIAGQELGIFGDVSKIDDRNLLDIYAGDEYRRNVLNALPNGGQMTTDMKYAYTLDGAREMAASLAQFSPRLRNSIIKSPAAKSVIGLMLEEKMRNSINE